MKILDAFKLASRLHFGQVDKAGRPYIEHLCRVFLRVADRGGDRDQQIAALLHDSIEDKRATARKLLDEGVPVGAVRLIETLSRGEGVPYFEYVAAVSQDPRASLVKEADLDDNSDPERLEALPAEVAGGLAKRYAKARQILAEHGRVSVQDSDAAARCRPAGAH